MATGMTGMTGTSAPTYYTYNRFLDTTIYGISRNLDKVDISGNIVENADSIIQRNLSIGGNLTVTGNLNASSIFINSSPLSIFMLNIINGISVYQNFIIMAQGFSIASGKYITANGLNIYDYQLGYLANVSSDIQTQINNLAPLASPTFTGIPLLTTTPTAGNSSQQIANTAFVSNAISSLSSGLNYAPLSSPVFINIPTCPTASAGTTTLQLSSTAFVQNAITNLISASTAYTGTNTFNSFLPSSTITASTTYQLTNKFYVDSVVASIFTLGHDYTKLNTFNSVLPTSTISATTTYQFTNKNYVDTALSNYALSANPTFSGTPLSTTALAGTNTTQISTTAFTVTAIANAISALGMGTYAKTFSPILTGTPLSSNPNVGDNTTQIATSYFTNIAISNAITTAITGLGMGNYALLNNPTFTGTPIAPTPLSTVNTTQISTTAYVTTGIANAITALGMTAYAKTVSPILTGTPTCPTAVSTINNTQIASTAFVKTASTALLSLVNTWTGTSNTFSNDIYVNSIQMGQGNTTNLNTCFGQGCLTANLGTQNTASGYFSMASNTTGSNNTAYGMGGLSMNTTGSNNTSIGYLANQNGNFSNTTSIGYSTAPTANNQIVLGTSSETTVIAGGLSIAKLPILSYTTLPTYTSNQIGYSAPITYTTGTSITNGGLVTLAKTTSPLPIGNYTIFWTSAMVYSGTTGAISIGLYGAILSSTVPTGFSGSSYTEVHNQTANTGQNQLYTSSAYVSPTTATFSVYLMAQAYYPTAIGLGITTSGISNLQVIRTS